MAEKKTKKPGGIKQIAAELGLAKLEKFTEPPKVRKLWTKVADNVPKQQDKSVMADLLELPKTKAGFHFLLVVVDLWSREIEFEPLKKKEATQVRDVEDIIARCVATTRRIDTVHVSMEVPRSETQLQSLHAALAVVAQHSQQLQQLVGSPTAAGGAGAGAAGDTSASLTRLERSVDGLLSACLPDGGSHPPDSKFGALRRQAVWEPLLVAVGLESSHVLVFCVCVCVC